MADENQYYLRSGSGEFIQVPIQIQSVEDSAFVLELLGHQTQVPNSDVNSDTASDCEANDDVVVDQSGGVWVSFKHKKSHQLFDNH